MEFDEFLKQHKEQYAAWVEEKKASVDKYICTIEKSQLIKALADLEQAEQNGFNFCQAVFSVAINKEGWLEFSSATYSDLVERAHPTDAGLNFGRWQNVSKDNKFVDGVLIPIRTANAKFQQPDQTDAV